MEKVHLGIIGCGGMGFHHARSLSKMENVEITGAADVDPEKLKRFTQHYSVKYSFSDYAQLLDIKEIDAVLICLPTFLHYPAVLLAARKGKHIFCEKPIAMKIEDAEEMIKVCRENNVKFMIGFVRRFDNFWGKAREVIREGILGRPVVWHDIRSSTGAPSDWYFNEEKGGGPLIDGAVHNYDFGHYTFGKVKRIFAATITFKKGISAIDTGSAILEYSSGDQHIISWSWGLPQGASGAQLIDIIGPKGALIFPGCFDEAKIPQSIDQNQYGVFLLNLKGERKEWIKWRKNDMFFDELKHFIDCIVDDKEPCVSGEDGKKALEIGLAVLKSGRTGLPIKINA